MIFDPCKKSCMEWERCVIKEIKSMAKQDVKMFEIMPKKQLREGHKNFVAEVWSMSWIGMLQSKKNKCFISKKETTEKCDGKEKVKG